MGIRFDSVKKIFHLTPKNSSYQMKVDEYGFLLHLYYGKGTEQVADFILTFADRGFSGNPYDTGNDRTYSMDILPQEFPVRGNGDYRNTALLVENAKGTLGCDLRYVSHRTYKGKYSLKGLPAVYASETEAETLEILMRDPVLKIDVTLLYGVLEKYDVFTRSVIVKNCSEENIYINEASSACLDFVTGNYEVIGFHGRHTMERNMERTRIGHHTYQIGSRRGTSSHQYNPMLILAEENTTEDAGNCYAMSFVYSGGFEASVEMDQMDQTRMLMGLQPEQLHYVVKKDDEFVIPEVILSYSAFGFNPLSFNLQKTIRHHVCRGKYQTSVRPILVNSWESAYFDINAEKLCDLAKHAADLGLEMLVMDDGWFGKRDDDNRGLGDWVANEDKLGMPLSDIIHKINAYGLKFGIWIEPEMVSEDSDLYRRHPDWALTIPGQKPIRARNQLVLDFSRKEVVDGIYKQISDLLDHNNIEYIKWDMNRSIYDVYSHDAQNQGNVLYDYVLGLYNFLERLHTNYPDILIEGCSGGGGRYDAGMLYYTPQIWCSDNTDAIDRLRIQYGTSFGYPISTVGAHVSAVPNHQTGRITPLETRGVVAMSGTFGYELDLAKLSDEEKKLVKKQVIQYKKYAPLISDGRYYRLSNPFIDEVTAWEFVSEDQKEILFNAVQTELHSNMAPQYVKMKGLKTGVVYKDMESGECYPADILMEIGLPIVSKGSEYQSYQMYLVMQ